LLIFCGSYIYFAKIDPELLRSEHFALPAEIVGTTPPNYARPRANTSAWYGSRGRKLKFGI